MPGKLRHVFFLGDRERYLYLFLPDGLQMPNQSITVAEIPFFYQLLQTCSFTEDFGIYWGSVLNKIHKPCGGLVSN